MIKISDKQKRLIHHTLGGEDPTHWYRNHYVASVDHSDYTDLCELEEKDLMKRARTPSFCSKCDIVFMVTEKGKTVVNV